MDKDGREEEKNDVVVGVRLTKLPSIRDLSFASRRPAGVGLAGIASDQFHHVSLLFASKSCALNFILHLAHVQIVAMVCLAPSLRRR